MPEIVVLGTKGAVHHANPLKKFFGEQIVVEPDWRPGVITAHNPDLVMTFEESQCERGLCIAEMARHNVATLLIMDGIPEWRNTWHRATRPDKRPINQPILSHKVACLGKLDARLFESWGNVGKCEVVGSPRLDPLIKLDKPMRLEPVSDRPMRLLVMTAKIPGFTHKEVENTLHSLEDLRDLLAGRNDIQVIWRITKGLHRQLRVKNSFTESTGDELYDVLAQVDAVITTPSTAMLEGMLFGLPVALLDYHNCPHYVPAAWQITCKDHIIPVLEDLRIAPLERMLYQDYCLHDALACKTPALPRVVKLIKEMVRIKREHDVNGTKDLVFPHRMLTQPEEFVAWPSENFDLQALYPSHPVFGRSDLVKMQAELEAAILTIANLKEKANILEDRLHRIPGYILGTRIVKRFQKWFA